MGRAAEDVPSAAASDPGQLREYRGRGPEKVEVKVKVEAKVEDEGEIQIEGSESDAAPVIRCTIQAGTG